jgi:hypothetical protein
LRELGYGGIDHIRARIWIRRGKTAGYEWEPPQAWGPAR